MNPYPDTLEVEAALLAGILAKPAAFLDVADVVEPGDFAEGFYGEVWRLAGECIRETGGQFSPVTLAARLAGFASDEFDPQAELVTLASNPVTTINIPNYAELVHEGGRLRRIHELTEQARLEVSRAHLGNGDAERIGSGLVTGALEASASNIELLDFNALSDRALVRLDEDLPSCSTGLQRLDRALGGGLFPGKLYGLCAPKKAGKTTLLSTIAYNLTDLGEPWAYCALEMGADQIFERMLARQMGVNSLRFLDPDKRREDWFRQKVVNATAWFRDRDGVFRSRPGMSLDELLALLARVALSGRYKGVFVDYLQLVGGRPKSMSDAYWLDHVAQSLAEAAKRYEIWIVVAAQIGRQGDVYGGDGLGRACDMNLKLCRVEVQPGDLPEAGNRAWIEMLDSRYTHVRDVGTEAIPAYVLNIGVGPYFEESPAPGVGKRW
jgi:replicative DNA helicase